MFEPVVLYDCIGRGVRLRRGADADGFRTVRSEDVTITEQVVVDAVAFTSSTGLITI